jgi:DTW domain-containing protein YfiP
VTLPAPRSVCERCRRPTVVCFCAQLPQLTTRTKVLVLQHLRERRVGIGTARMAHLALPNSVMRVGIDFERDPVVAATLARSSATYVLFPGPDAKDVRELDPAQPITLVVVDGTWSQARTLIRINPTLAALPRLAFSPRRTSEYNRIRREPADFCVSTIEALTEVLHVLEPDGERFDEVLAPFRAMVERQARFAVEVQSHRHQRGERPVTRSPREILAERLVAEWPRLVCVQGEANGWPARDPGRHDPETVHFVALRPATGERYEARIAPRRPLAPLTPRHVGLDELELRAGGSVAAWHGSWAAFARPHDVVVQWGSFATNLATAEGLALAARRIDLRGELSHSGIRAPGGTLDACVAQLVAMVAPTDVGGRAGQRLAQLHAVLQALTTPPF